MGANIYDEQSQKVISLLRLFSLVIVFFLSIQELANADVFDHLKKITDKSGSHCMENIDFIYTINLDQRPEKFASCVEQLTPYNIFPYRFSAVNGWELPVEVLNDCGVVFQPGMEGGHMASCYLPENKGRRVDEPVSVIGRNYYGHCQSAGCIAIVLSHLSVLQDAYDSGYETIWVMEDDIEVLQNPHLISTLIDKLDQAVGRNGWDILFTDRDTKSNKGEYIICVSYAWRPNFTPSNPARFAVDMLINDDFRKIGARYGAYSMIVRRSGIIKLLNFYHQYQPFLPYDMDYTQPNDIHLYTVRKDVVSFMPNSPSDNGNPNYLNKK